MIAVGSGNVFDKADIEGKANIEFLIPGAKLAIIKLRQALSLPMIWNNLIQNIIFESKSI